MAMEESYYQCNKEGMACIVCFILIPNHPYSYDYSLANHFAPFESSANQVMSEFSRRFTSLEKIPATGFKIFPLKVRILEPVHLRRKCDFYLHGLLVGVVGESGLRLSTSQDHITDCKMDSWCMQVYEGVGVVS